MRKKYVQRNGREHSPYWSKKLATYFGIKSPLTYPQELATLPYAEPIEPNPLSQQTYLRLIFPSTDSTE
jgi:hypothetical protein